MNLESIAPPQSTSKGSIEQKMKPDVHETPEETALCLIKHYNPVNFLYLDETPVQQNMKFMQGKLTDPTQEEEKSI